MRYVVYKNPTGRGGIERVKSYDHKPTDDEFKKLPPGKYWVLKFSKGKRGGSLTRRFEVKGWLAKSVKDL